MKLRLVFAVAATIANAVIAEAQVYPTPKEGDWVARDFRFHTGEVMPELRIHYTTVGEPSGQPVLMKLAPTREAADKLLNERLAAPFPLDANDVLYMWDASRDYNPSPELERIKAVVLAINSADDERNPPETGIMERELKRIKDARLYLIPASEDTRGHLTTGFAKFWKQPAQELLSAASRLDR